MAGSPSSSSFSLHAHACLVGEPHRMFLQHPQQAGSGAQRPAFQAGSQGTSPPLPRQLQPDTCNPFTWTKGPEHLQRIIETTKDYQAAHPQEASPSTSQAKESRFYKGLMGRCTSLLTNYMKMGLGQTTTPQLSLFFFSADSAEQRDCKYRMLLESAKFADEHGKVLRCLP